MPLHYICHRPLFRDNRNLHWEEIFDNIDLELAVYLFQLDDREFVDILLGKAPGSDGLPQCALMDNMSTLLKLTALYWGRISWVFRH